MLPLLRTTSRRTAAAAAAAAASAAATALLAPRPTSCTPSPAATTPEVSANPARRLAVPGTATLNAAARKPLGLELAPSALLSPGNYRVTIDDPDVRCCVVRGGARPGLERAYDTHALVFWPEDDDTNKGATEGCGHEYGVVFIPGTGAGIGPAYRHRPARNRYPGPIDVATFDPQHEAFFMDTARTRLAPAGVPVVQITWSDFRSPPASPEEKAYGYDGASKANPAGADGMVDVMADVASAKVEAAVKLLLLNGCKSVVLAGHSMGAAIACEAARRLVAQEPRAPGEAPAEPSGRWFGGGGAGQGWRRPEQLRALCLLSGAAVHWTLGPWKTLEPANSNIPPLRLPPHRVLTREAGRGAATSLLETHSVPVLVVNAEHDIACAKGVYWEEEGEGASGMFAETACDYFVLEDHTHSWFRGTDAKAPTNVAAEGGRTEAERAAAAGDGREVFDVAPTNAVTGALFARWVAENSRERWREAVAEGGGQGAKRLRAEGEEGEGMRLRGGKRLRAAL